MKDDCLNELHPIDSIDALVTVIRLWYESNHKGFADLYNQAVKNVRPIPAGTSPAVIHDWKDATIQDLCAFFKEWYRWNPNLTTGLDYIQKFSWLYYLNEQGLAFVKSDVGYYITRSFVQINGVKMNSPESRELVKIWEAELGDEMNDYVIPEGGYPNFNSFFSRELKPGMRPVSSPQDDSVAVSPADAIVNMIADQLTPDTKLPCKTQNLSVSQLLNGSAFAERFTGGTAVSCILMPTVYHRYHAPVKGTVVESREDVAGHYFGIDNFPELLNNGNVGYGYDYSVFEHFRRGYAVIETQDYGCVAMIPVGLNTIASVVFQDKFKHVDPSAPVPVEKGEEIGYFRYGGSLNILLFEPGVFPSLRIPQGQMIGRMNPKKKTTDKPKPAFVF